MAVIVVLILVAVFTYKAPAARVEQGQSNNVAWLRSSIITNRRAARSCQQTRLRTRTAVDHAERSSNPAYLGWARRMWKSRYVTCERKLASDKRRWKAEPVAYAKQIAHYLLARRGWSDQFYALDGIIMVESHWHVWATNPSSGACGIAQALPCSKMASMGADYRTSPLTELRWLIHYAVGRYGSICAAYRYRMSHGYY